jgi:hypothetical protein
MALASRGWQQEVGGGRLIFRGLAAPGSIG